MSSLSIDISAVVNMLNNCKFAYEIPVDSWLKYPTYFGHLPPSPQNNFVLSAMARERVAPPCTVVIKLGLSLWPSLDLSFPTDSIAYHRLIVHRARGNTSTIAFDAIFSRRNCRETTKARPQGCPSQLWCYSSWSATHGPT